jgi:hypothetical protein
VDPRADLDYVEKILTHTGLEFRPLVRPARSQSLYRLHYHGSLPVSNSVYYHPLQVSTLFLDHHQLVKSLKRQLPELSCLTI